ncbi:MAG: hypothetical protein HY248_06440 [Fimbriimonas ginsengisoli]|uniref:Lipid-A-disaccharide synthase n=1 Tax=Fimbriimonas ginsengisoli TaxID=1005039 RepID=A0A931LSS5_FIMGI|nr:hypothetical protein [Fimbriimonas ginsengisoli]MBI3722176.1 hypothetical protein [Fimbriimonas ginsengisoli]
MRVFLSAGEASGDLYAAALVREMRRLAPDRSFTFEGLGMARLRSEGVDLVADTSNWGAIGIPQALARAPHVLARLPKVAARLRAGSPGLFVAVDFGYVNMRLCRTAKAAGWKVLYFMPPGAWQRGRTAGELPPLTDAISTPFEWSARTLSEAGANAHWFGHPLLQIFGQAGIDGPRDGLAILPGSRDHELRLNLPITASVVRGWPEGVEFALAPGADRDRISAMWSRLAPDRRKDKFTVGAASDVLRRAMAALVCSGTATLEAALADCPMVVIYRTGPLTHLQAYLAGFKGRSVSLPNILLQRAVVPEFAGWRLRPAAISTALRALMTDGNARNAQLEAFAEISTVLGPRDAVTRTAELALGMA